MINVKDPPFMEPLISVGMFTIWLFNSLPWKDPPIFKWLGHLYHGYVSHKPEGNYWFPLSLSLGLRAMPPNDWTFHMGQSLPKTSEDQDYIPYAPCMEYLPTFALQITQM